MGDDLAEIMSTTGLQSSSYDLEAIGPEGDLKPLWER